MTGTRGWPLLALGISAVAAGCTMFQSAHERGDRALRRGDFRGAAAAYEEAIDAGEYPAVAYANRCYALEALGDREAAYQDCTRALDLVEKGEVGDSGLREQEVLNNRAVVLIGLGRFDEAIDDLTAAVELDDEYAEAFANRGRAHVELEQYDEALEDLGRAVELNPDLAEALANTAQAHVGKGEPDLALEAFGRALDVSDGDPEIYFSRAGLHYAIGNFREALDDYRSVVERSDNEYLTWMAQQQVNFLKNIEDDDEAAEAP